MLLLPACKKDELFDAIKSGTRLHFMDRGRNIKDFFFPQTEDIVSFKTGKHEVGIETAADSTECFAVYGVTACDAEGLNILDRVFLKEPADTFYRERREKGTIITMACFRPSETCFCGNFSIDAAEPGGDVAVFEMGDILYWKIKTEKGSALTEIARDLFREADGGEEAALVNRQAQVNEMRGRLPLSNFTFSGRLSLQEKFNSPVWEALHKTCLGCGTCTFICPTCHCYDIRDIERSGGAVRYRCWDSCMYEGFTQMSHGNPRPNHAARFRQRFMHKLVYFPENNDNVKACTGCGRCIVSCPVSMSIVKAARALEVCENVQA